MLKPPNPTIVLLGNPNSGKTTLFNYLTGRKQPVGNWSGVTVAAHEGTGSIGNRAFDVIDLPGTYSLVVVEDDTLHDEAVPATFLKAQPFSFVLNVVDALTLERQLYLTLQALEQQIPMAVVINRLDLLVRQGKSLSLAKLESALGCRVMAVDTQQPSPKDHHKAWLKPLFTLEAWDSSSVCQRCHYPPFVEQQLHQLAQQPEMQHYPRWQLVHWLEGEKPSDPRIITLIKAAQSEIEKALGQSADVIIAKSRYDFIERCLQEAVSSSSFSSMSSPSLSSSSLSSSSTSSSSSPFQAAPKSLSDKIDAVLCHRYWGLPCFLAIMYGLFFFAIGIGGEFQDFFESAAQFVFIEGVSKGLTAISAPVWVNVLLVVGLGQGVTTIVTFIPVIGAMFFALSFLEECGYMARAAFVMDRLMRAVGLPGKSFVPMIIGFGCNVPAILGTRALDNKRDRILGCDDESFYVVWGSIGDFYSICGRFFPARGRSKYRISVVPDWDSDGYSYRIIIKKDLAAGE